MTKATVVPPAAEKKADALKVKTPKHRSPNYPAIGLRRALERAKELYDTYKRGSIPLMVALQKWNYKQSLGVAAQTIAALKSYGLIDVDGEGEKRTVKVTERAQMILGNHPDRTKFLRQAALEPSIYKEMWEKQNSGTETDEAMKVYLHWDRKFNPESIDGLIADFRDTISFAELVPNGKMGDEATDEVGGGPPRLAPPIGSMTMQAAATIKNPPPAAASGMKQDVFTLEEGSVVLQYPTALSKDSFQDLEDWVKLQLRKIGRTIIQASNDGRNEEGASNA